MQRDTWLQAGWMQTYTGRRFFPVDPRAEDVDIRDIAHALAMICRYGGHSKFHYSVAQHSVLMAEKADAVNALRALMHDSPEAYTGDIIRPLKKDPRMAPFGEVERAVELAICNRFGLPFHIMNAEIKRLDNAILHDERAQVLTHTDHDWDVDGEPLGVEIVPWAPEVAREKFLRAYETYSRWSYTLRDVA